MIDKTDATVKLFSYEDDQPHEQRGKLIPGRVRSAFRGGQHAKQSKDTFTPAAAITARQSSKTHQLLLATRAGVVAAVALLAVMTVGTTYGLVSRAQLAAAPTLTVVDPYTKQTSILPYGPQPALGNSTFLLQIREAFLEEGQTFVEADLTQRQLRFFKNGVLLQSAPIESVGKPGSWWTAPSGLYQIEQKKEQSFSNLAQAYFPWQLTFEGNFAIHGWPTYPDGSDVMSEFDGGGIRLSTKAAEELYHQVRTGVPVLIHQKLEVEPDTFVYEPKISDAGIEHYFIADIKNGTILAASDVDKRAPIASLTKLMTAVVAAEELDLDGRVRVTSPTFVTSLIPRLAERSSVSMYSLLQLLLVESSNEAAETIAGELGRDDFLAAMNRKAHQLGMLNTTFTDPSGLDSGNVSTVGDLYRLISYIYHDRPFILEITKNNEVPDTYVGNEFNDLVNFNQIKGVNSFVGGKVGETLAAGQTSISLHEINFDNEQRLLAIILLGSKDRSADIEQLLEYVNDRYQ